MGLFAPLGMVIVLLGAAGAAGAGSTPPYGLPIRNWMISPHCRAVVIGPVGRVSVYYPLNRWTADLGHKSLVWEMAPTASWTQPGLKAERTLWLSYDGDPKERFGGLRQAGFGGSYFIGKKDTFFVATAPSAQPIRWRAIKQPARSLARLVTAAGSEKLRLEMRTRDTLLAWAEFQVGDAQQRDRQARQADAIAHTGALELQHLLRERKSPKSQCETITRALSD